MAAYVKFQKFVEQMPEKQVALDVDVLKIALTNVAPNAALDEAFGDITEVAAGNGYTAGGEVVTVSSSMEVAGTYKLVGSAPAPTWTATGGQIGPFRYVVLYDEDSGDLISFYDNGSSITLNPTETFTVTFDPVNGILQIA